MTLAIKIGAGSQVYDNIALAYSMRGNQKLSITGSGSDIYTALSTLTANADGIGSIKATSDIVVNASEVTANKASLVKLGTKSLVLQGAGAGGVETAANVSSNFSALDAVYTKMKALNISADTTIDVSKLSTAVNLGAMEVLSGKKFNVSGSASDIQNYMSSLLKNNSMVGSITISAGQELQLNASQLSALGDKLNKSVGGTVTAQSGTSTAVTTASAHNLNNGDAITFTGTTGGGLVQGTTYYARALTSTTFAVYDSKAHANDVNYTVGIIDTSAVSTGSFSKPKATVALRDTADNLLTTANLALINKYNNTNLNPLNTVPSVTAQASGVLTSTNHGLNTGDAVTYDGTAISAVVGPPAYGALADGQVAYARKLSDNTFALYDTYQNAVTTSSTSGLIGSAAASTSGVYTTQAGNAPIRVTTLDNVQVTNASLKQVDTLSSLTALVGSPGLGSVNRSLSNIVSSVEVNDTLSKLTAGVTQTVAGLVSTGVAGATDGIFNISTHGYSTGDAITLNTTGTKSAAGLVNGTAYYVGVLDTDHFALYDTKAAALAMGTTGNDAAKYALSAWKNIGAASGTGTFTTTRSNLESTMKAVTTYKDATGTVNRVTIKGSGAILATDLESVSSKALRGNSAVNVAYAAKGVDIQNNLQALYDNNTTTGSHPLTEIVVTDGTAIGKKGFSLSQTFYNALKTVFANGVDNPAGKTTNKNYSFTVTNATFDHANPTLLQNDVNVSTYAITGTSYSDLDPIANPDYLRVALGQSKLKSLTTTSISDTTQRSIITNLLNAIGNPVDRAKLKLTA